MFANSLSQPFAEETRRKEVELKWQQMEKTVKPIVAIIESEEVAKKLQEARDRESNQQVLQYLIKEHDVSDFGCLHQPLRFQFHESMLDTLYECAKFQFECGSYEFASPYLQMFRTLVPPTHRHYLDAMWGKLACEILLQHWDEAREDFTKLKSFIESHVSDSTTDLFLLCSNLAPTWSCCSSARGSSTGRCGCRSCRTPRTWRRRRATTSSSCASRRTAT